MTDIPILRIACRPATKIRIGNRVQPGVLIAAADMRLLRQLSGRDLVIMLACPGQRPYHAHLRALLNRAIQIPGEPVWFVPTSHTGPLKPPIPSPRNAAGRN